MTEKQECIIPSFSSLRFHSFFLSLSLSAFLSLFLFFYCFPLFHDFSSLSHSCFTYHYHYHHNKQFVVHTHTLLVLLHEENYNNNTKSIVVHIYKYLCVEINKKLFFQGIVSVLLCNGVKWVLAMFSTLTWELTMQAWKGNFFSFKKIKLFLKL